MRGERNRTICHFEMDGESYMIHQRSNLCSDGSRYTRRFACDGRGEWVSWARTPTEAKVIKKMTAPEDHCNHDVGRDQQDWVCRTCGKRVTL